MRSTINKTHISFIAALLLAILAAYSNVYDNAFLFDDEFLIVKNTFLKSFSNVGLIVSSSSTAGFGGVDSFYRPLQGLLYLITYQLAGLSTFAFHALNLLLHCANAILLFMLGVRLGFKPWAVFFASLLWALHPLHVEAVTYMSATADPLYAALCLTGLLVLLPDVKARKMLVAASVFAIALCAKETALVFPLLVMTCLFLTSDKRYDFKTYFKTWPLWLVAASYILLRMTYLKFDGLDFYKISNLYTENVLVRFTTFLATLPDYLALIIFPHGLHMDRHFPVYVDWLDGKVLAGAALFIIATATALFSIVKKKTSRSVLILCWSLLWFGAAHLLHTGVLLPVNAFFLEHWMYMPMMGLALGLGELAYAGIARLKSQETHLLCISAVIVVAGAFGFSTYQYNSFWATPISFYSNILSYGVQNARIHNNIAMAYEDKGELDNAKTHYEKAIAENDQYAQTHYNLVLLLLKLDAQNNIPAAITHLTRAIEINPDFFRAYSALAQLYEATADNEKASIYRQKHQQLQKRFLGE